MDEAVPRKQTGKDLCLTGSLAEREAVIYTEAVRCTWLQIPAALVTNEMSFYLILLKHVPSLQPSFQDQMKQFEKPSLSGTVTYR